MKKPLKFYIFLLPLLLIISDNSPIAQVSSTTEKECSAGSDSGQCNSQIGVTARDQTLSESRNQALVRRSEEPDNEPEPENPCPKGEEGDKASCDPDVGINNAKVPPAVGHICGRDVDCGERPTVFNPCSAGKCGPGVGLGGIEMTISYPKIELNENLSDGKQ